MAFYVLGSGGAKYGPVDTAKLNEWITQNRVSSETLIEDIGSGVKMPARAVPGLTFAPGLATAIGRTEPPTAAPFAGATPHRPPPSTMAHSTYVRPGAGTGGSQHNLFLPGADSKWAWQSLACVVATIGVGGLLWLTHFYIGRLLILAVIIPLAGIQRGYAGIERNRALSALMVSLNALALVGAAAVVARGLIL